MNSSGMRASCAACGHENPDGNRFCGGCGAALEVAAPRSGGAAAPEAENAITLCRRTLRGNVEAVSHGILARTLLRRDGAAAREPAERALASAAELIERTGATTLSPFLLEWRAELAAVLGDDATREQLLRQAQQGDEEIGAPLHAARLRTEHGSRGLPPRAP